MKKGTCYIVGGGKNYGIGFAKTENDYVIAADAGYTHLVQAGIGTDLVIGDFDSLPYPPEHNHIIRLCKDKDETDTFVALCKGIEAGYTRFCFYCCTGGRPDHTYGNIQLLAYLSNQKMRGFLIDRASIFTTVTDGSICMTTSDGYISVFAYSDKAEGVSLKGLKYELHDATLTSLFPLGISNEIKGASCEVSVKHGTLLIVYPIDTMEVL